MLDRINDKIMKQIKNVFVYIDKTFNMKEIETTLT
jgi:hypothetical protein